MVAVLSIFGILPLSGVKRMSPRSRAAGAAEVRVAEAENRRIGIMISRTAVPRFQPRVGAELHHAEGNRGAGIGVSVLGRADHGPNALAAASARRQGSLEPQAMRQSLAKDRPPKRDH